MTFSASTSTTTWPARLRLLLLGIPIRGYKVFAGWVGEKAGRAKQNVTC